MTAKLVTAMTWTGFDAARHQGQLAGRAAQFSKTGGVWTRTDHAPVNPGTCTRTSRRAEAPARPSRSYEEHFRRGFDPAESQRT